MLFKQYDSNEIKRESLNSIYTTSTANTRTSSVVVAAKPNLGMTSEQITNLDREGLHQEYGQSSVGKQQQKKFKNVPLDPAYADRLNEENKVSFKRLKDQMFEESKRQARLMKYLKWSFLVILGIVGVTVGVVLAMGGNDGNDDEVLFENSTLNPTFSPSLSPTNSPTIEAIILDDRGRLTRFCQGNAPSFFACISNGEDSKQIASCENGVLSDVENGECTDNLCPCDNSVGTLFAPTEEVLACNSTGPICQEILTGFTVIPENSISDFELEDIVGLCLANDDRHRCSANFENTKIQPCSLSADTCDNNCRCPSDLLITGDFDLCDTTLIC